MVRQLVPVIKPKLNARRPSPCTTSWHLFLCLYQLNIFDWKSGPMLGGAAHRQGLIERRRRRRLDCDDRSASTERDMSRHHSAPMGGPFRPILGRAEPDPRKGCSSTIDNATSAAARHAQAAVKTHANAAENSDAACPSGRTVPRGRTGKVFGVELGRGLRLHAERLLRAGTRLGQETMRSS
jgi:hypothetical protein